jgi:hypothetical protein
LFSVHQKTCFSEIPSAIASGVESVVKNPVEVGGISLGAGAAVTLGFVGGEAASGATAIGLSSGVLSLLSDVAGALASIRRQAAGVELG